MMQFARIIEQEREFVKKELKYNEDEMKTKSDQIKEWWTRQPHLPELPEKGGDNLISFYMLGAKMSTEKTKIKLDSYYSLRHQIPELFTNPDPMLPEIRESVNKIGYFPTPHLTPQGYRVHMIIFKDGYTPQDLVSFHKRLYAIGHLRATVYNDIGAGEIIVLDSKGFTMTQLKNNPWAHILRFLTITQQMLPVKIKGIYSINAPGIAESAMNIIKPVLNKKIQDRIRVFQGDHKNLFKYIPKKSLPSDYGGEGPSSEELNRAWQNTLELRRDYIIEESKRISDESKRPKDSKNTSSQMFGVNGSFNKLNID